MKNRILAVVLTILLCLTAFVGCKNDNSVNSGNNSNDDSARTTITEDEWNTALQIRNFTMVWEIFVPDGTKLCEYHQMRSDNAIFVEKTAKDQSEQRYEINVGGYCCIVKNVDGIWCNSLSESPFYIQSFSDFHDHNPEFKDLTYDEANKNYNGSVVLDNGETISISYFFKNGVLTKVIEFDEYGDKMIFSFTDIGTTVVNVPDSIPLSTHYVFKVFPDCGGCEKMDISLYSLPSTIKEVYRAGYGGYIFFVEFKGYSSKNVAVIGVDGNGNVIGTKVIESDDVMGLDGYDEFDNNGCFIGVNLDTIDGVDIVAGCTLSIAGYRSAVKDALASAKILEIKN